MDRPPSIGTEYVITMATPPLGQTESDLVYDLPLGIKTSKTVLREHYRRELRSTRSYIELYQTVQKCIATIH